MKSSLTSENETHANSISYLKVNIRGLVYRIDKQCLAAHPECRLSTLTTSLPQYDTDTGQYYFNRNAQIFNCILNYFVNSSMGVHLPTRLVSVI